jgi:hypothetical protein
MEDHARVEYPFRAERSNTAGWLLLNFNSDGRWVGIESWSTDHALCTIVVLKVFPDASYLKHLLVI